MSQPLWSVMIPAYNNADYLGETLRSVLGQDPGADRMQIAVVDDHSSQEAPERVTRAIGGERVDFFRQPRNLGMVANFNDCIARARGEWVHILHTDDWVLPGFYRHAEAAIGMHPEIGAWTCQLVYADKDGLWVGLSDLEARGAGVLDWNFVLREFVTPRIQFVGIVVRRSVYQQLGGFRPELKFCLDWDMWKRVVCHYPVYYDPTPLACFRLHPASAYAAGVRTGASVADERKSIEMSKTYLPADWAGRIRDQAMREAALRAVRTARQQWRSGDRRAARNLSIEALRCSLAPGVLARLPLIVM